MIGAHPDHEVAALALLSLGGLSLASQVHRRLFPTARYGFLGCYSAVLAAVVGWGLLVAPPPAAWLPSAPRTWAVLVTAGLAAGGLARWLDVTIVRALPQPRVLKRPRQRGWTQGSGPIPPAVPVPPVLQPGIPGAALLFLVGGLEEIVHRGFLVNLSLGLPSSALVVAALVANPLFFGLTHLELDWRAAVSKTPLGVLALGLTLATGTPAGAVVAHLTFNGAVLRDAARVAAGSRTAVPVAVTAR